jgi:hypothetical protein
MARTQRKTTQCNTHQKSIFWVIPSSHHQLRSHQKTSSSSISTLLPQQHAHHHSVLFSLLFFVVTRSPFCSISLFSFFLLRACLFVCFFDFVVAFFLSFYTCSDVGRSIPRSPIESITQEKEREKQCKIENTTNTQNEKGKRLCLERQTGDRTATRTRDRHCQLVVCECDPRAFLKNTAQLHDLQRTLHFVKQQLDAITTLCNRPASTTTHTSRSTTHNALHDQQRTRHFVKQQLDAITKLCNRPASTTTHTTPSTTYSARSTTTRCHLQPSRFDNNAHFTIYNAHYTPSSNNSMPLRCHHDTLQPSRFD